MGMRLWMGGEFNKSHERAALRHLLSDAVARWGEERHPYALFVDFWVGSAKIDLVAVTEHSLVIIDLKEVGAENGYLTGSLNGSWWHIAPDGNEHEVNPNRQNPFRQVESYRQEMIDWLRNAGPGILGSQKCRTLDLLQIDAWIVASPSLDEARTSRELDFIPARDRRWFRALGLNALCDALFDTVRTGLTFTEDQIAAMAAAHGLSEKRSFAGFTWPGEAALPASPLFAAPPAPRGCVDREDTVAEALAALEGSGAASVLTLVGPEGAGKSHVAKLIAKQLRESNRRVVWIDCGAARRCEVTIEELLLALANEMPRGPGRQAVMDRDLPLMHRVSTALNWCEQAGLALIFDEYHELPVARDIRRFIQQLDQQCACAQAIVISASRPDYLTDAIHPLGAARTIEIAGLPAERIVEFLAARSNAAGLRLQLDEVDVTTIWEKTGGLPTLLNILALMSANTRPDRVAAQVAAHPEAKEWLEGLLRRVSENARRLAAAAAVAPRAVERDFLLALTDAGNAAELVNELVDAYLLRVTEDGRFALIGGLRERLLDRTPAETTRKAHERAARYLIRQSQHTRAGWLLTLEEGIRHALAAERWRLALDHAPKVADELRRLGERERCLAVCRQAADAAQKLSLPAEVARWQIEQAALLRHMGQVEEATRFCEAAIKRADKHSSPVLARAYHVLGGLAMDRSDYEAAREYCEQALALDRRLQAKAHEAASLARLAELEARAGRSEQARELYRQSFALTESGSDEPAALARRHFDYSLVEKYDGNLAAALAHLEQALVYADRAGGATQRSIILSQMAEVRGRLGDYEAALQLMDESLRLRQGVADPRGLQISLGIKFDILLDAGELGRAGETLREINALVTDSLDPTTAAFQNRRHGLMALAEGRTEEGLAMVEKARAAFAAMGKQHWRDDCEKAIERVRARYEPQWALPPDN
jgi:tetratricopeptide (TPR) repeat protein